MMIGAADEAERLKAEANKLFAAGRFSESDDLYSKAIELNPNVPAYWSNRAFTNMKLENYGYAIRDATEAIKLDPTFIKAYYRRASANMALLKFKEALKDLKTVNRYAPHDADAKTKYAEAEKIVRRMEFEKALAYEETRKSIIDSMDLSAMLVESSYDGLRWGGEEEPLTLEFVSDMLNRFEQQKRVHRRYLTRLLKQAKQILVDRPTLVPVRVPTAGKLTICGDVHGQFYDFLHIFRKNGFPSSQHAYLFNGDFVDRGSFSAEIIITLMAFLCLYPDSMFLSRGNHETDDMNRMYGFEGEMKAKYSETFFKAFSEIFCSMPLGHVIEKRVFVVHGGLFTRDDVTLEELGKIDRFKQPPSEGLMCELLWADPMPRPGREMSKRGVGLQFGPDVTENFLRMNNLDLLVRSHEVRQNGYTIDHNGKCVTIFSAPNYCDSVGNKGAWINITKNDGGDRPELDFSYEVFEAVPHPSVRPMQYAYGAGIF